VPLAGDIALFAAAAVLIAVVGTRLAYLADRLADRTGMGEAIAGAVFLGASTSLSGLTTSVTAAAGGYAGLALGNAIGGIAAQTAFLAVADLFYRRANLEHAAASVPNILQAGLLVVLLSIPLLGSGAPEVTFLGVHPATLLMLGMYAYGLHLVSVSRDQPMWTREDIPEQVPGEDSAAALGVRFVGLALMMALAGWVIARTGVSISAATGMSELAVGTVLTAVATSLPELVTTIAAVRRGALTLAVGDIIGGNTFDTLFVAISDVAYREGSIYHAAAGNHRFLMTLTIAMTGVLLMGLVLREKHGVANIGFESVLVLLFYSGGIAVLLSSA
jgi:cation:H+ antiporter